MIVAASVCAAANVADGASRPIMKHRVRLARQSLGIRLQRRPHIHAHARAAVGERARVHRAAQDLKHAEVRRAP